MQEPAGDDLAQKLRFELHARSDVLVSAQACRKGRLM
jgi:hypothetical protein